MPTEREVQHPDGRVERITETSAAPTTVVERRGSGMGAIVALILDKTVGRRTHTVTMTTEKVIEQPDAA